MKKLFVSLVFICLLITACTNNQNSGPSPASTLYPTYTPKPTPTPRPDGEVDAEITVYIEPWGIYGFQEWFSQEVVTTLYPGDSVTILGQLGNFDWIFVETDDGEQGWIANKFKDSSCILIDWMGSSEILVIVPDCHGSDTDRWMYINVDIAEVPQLPLDLPSGALHFGPDEGDNTLVVHNSADQDAVVAIVNVDEPAYLKPDIAIGSKNFVYVKAGETASFGKIIGGPYEVYVTFGEDWYPGYGAFSKNPSYWKLLEPYDFPFIDKITCTLQGVNCDSKTYSLELSEISGDSLNTIMITADEFPKVNLSQLGDVDDYVSYPKFEVPATSGSLADLTCTDPQEGTLPPYVDILGFDFELEGEEIYAEIFLSGLPDTLTFNREGTDPAVEEYGWDISIDVDNSIDTGYFGFDYELSAGYYPSGEYPEEIELMNAFWTDLYKFKSQGGLTRVDENEGYFEINQITNSILLRTIIPGINKNARFSISSWDVNPAGDPLFDDLECEIIP